MTKAKYYLYDVGNEIMLNDEFNVTYDLDSAVLYTTKKEAMKARTRAKRTYKNTVPKIEILKVED